MSRAATVLAVGLACAGFGCVVAFAAWLLVFAVTQIVEWL